MIGNLYTMDYLEYYRHVESAAVKAGNVLFVYENGQRVKPADTHIYGYDDSDYGKFCYFEFQPENSDSLSWLLSGERTRRNACKSGDFAHYATRYYLPATWAGVKEAPALFITINNFHQRKRGIYHE